MEIRKFDENDFQEIMKIYAEGIATGMATFETSLPSWETWDNAHTAYGRIAVFENKSMMGWASLSPVSSRCVYGGVAEVSVYVSENARGKGIGKLLMNELISISESNGIWTLQSGVFRANKSSIALHEKVGFRIIGHKEKIAQLNGVWYDNMLLERRSKVVGV